MSPERERLSAANNDLRVEVARLATTNDALAEKSRQISETVAALNSDLEALVSKIDSQRRSAAEASNEWVEVQNDLQIQRKRYLELTNDVHRLTAEHGRRERDLKVASGRLLAVQRRLEDFRKKELLVQKTLSVETGNGQKVQAQKKNLEDCRKELGKQLKSLKPIEAL